MPLLGLPLSGTLGGADFPLGHGRRRVGGEDGGAGAACLVPVGRHTPAKLGCLAAAVPPAARAAGRHIFSRPSKVSLELKELVLLRIFLDSEEYYTRKNYTFLYDRYEHL